MWKKILLLIGSGAASLCFALVPVEVNKADQAMLDGIKGIGPATSRAILEERKRAGPFKDWNDFSARVKGIGDKRSASLSRAGLTVNGLAKGGLPAAAAEKADTRPSRIEIRAADGRYIKLEPRK